MTSRPSSAGYHNVYGGVARRRLGRWAARLSLVAPLACGAFAVAACTNDEQDGAVPTERPDSSSQPPDAPGDLAEAGDARDARDDGAFIDAKTSSCNPLNLDGVTAAVKRAVTDIAPSPTGGIIEDGTYVATEYVIYGRLAAVPPSPFVRSKLVISGGTWQSVTGSPSGDAGAFNAETVQASTSSTTLTLIKACPKAGPSQTYGYTFATNEGGTKQLRYFNGTVEVGAITFEKQ